MSDCDCEITSFRTCLRYIVKKDTPLGNRGRVALMLTIAVLTGAVFWMG